MTHAYALFETTGDGDGLTIFDLLGLFVSVDAAKKRVAQQIAMLRAGPAHDPDNTIPSEPEDTDPEDPFTSELTIVHPDMNEANSWTHVGTREQCSRKLPYSRYGGYVIEDMAVEESDAAPSYDALLKLANDVSERSCRCLEQPLGGDGRLARRCVSCRAKTLVGYTGPHGSFPCSEDDGPRVLAVG